MRIGIEFVDRMPSLATPKNAAEPGWTMTRKSSRKKAGYAAWLLAKVFDELTGNYSGNATAENRVKELASEGSCISDTRFSYVEKPDRYSDTDFN